MAASFATIMRKGRCDKTKADQASLQPVAVPAVQPITPGLTCRVKAHQALTRMMRATIPASFVGAIVHLFFRCTWCRALVLIGSFLPCVNACVLVRRNKFDPPLFSPFSYSQLTTSKVHAHVCSATEQMDAAPPPCGRSSPPGHSVVDGWRRDERTRDRLQNLPRSLVSSPKPTTGVQVVRPAAPTASTRSLRMPAEQGLSTPARAMRFSPTKA